MTRKKINTSCGKVYQWHTAGRCFSDYGCSSFLHQ